MFSENQLYKLNIASLKINIQYSRLEVIIKAILIFMNNYGKQFKIGAKRDIWQYFGKFGELIYIALQFL